MGYTHGTKWTDEKIKEGILTVVKECNLDRMPSSSEVIRFYNNRGLANAISRRKGWYKLADELGLKIKDSETYFGKSYEELTRQKLISLGFEVEKMSQNFPYDLLVNNAIKVDVKASRLYKGEQGNFYSFNLEKPYTTCDILILIAVNENKEIQKYFVIPSVVVYHHTQISIGESKSKYDKYENKWSYFDKYSEFIDNEICL